MTNAILWVSHPSLMLDRIAGMTVIERQLFTAARAGIKHLWIAAARPTEAVLSKLRLPKQLQLNWIDKTEGRPSDCLPPYLGISGDHFIRVETLRQATQQRCTERIAFEDEDGSVVIETVPHDEKESTEGSKQPLPKNASVRLERPLSQGPALLWLLGGGPKPTDGFMARYFDRAISLRISHIILDTPVTPNMMTVLSCCIGIAGALMFLRNDWIWTMAGSVLIWLHSVLDGCDGELARIRFQESPFGAVLDFWGDNVVHVCLFMCLALGFFFSGNALAVFLGAAAAAGTLGSAFIAYRQKQEDLGPVGAPVKSGDDWLLRLETTLAQRDFIYLLLLLAYFDRTYEFLWAAAVGSLIFLAMLSFSSSRWRLKREQT